MGFLAIVNAPVVAFPSCAITFVHLLSNCHTQVCVDFPCRLSKHLARHTTGYTTGDTTANTAMEIATNAPRDTSGFTAWYGCSGASHIFTNDTAGAAAAFACTLHTRRCVRRVEPGDA